MSVLRAPDLDVYRAMLADGAFVDAPDIAALLSEIDRLRSERDLYRDGIRRHEVAARADYAESEWSLLAEYDVRLWSLLAWQVGR